MDNLLFLVMHQLMFLIIIIICYQCVTSQSIRAYSRASLGRHLDRSNLLLSRVQDPVPTFFNQTLVSGSRYNSIGLSPLVDLMVPGEFMRICFT